MKKFLCFLLLAGLLTATACQALPNIDEQSGEASSSAADISAPSQSQEVSGGEESVSGDVSDLFIESSEDESSAVAYEYAIDIIPYADAVNSENLLIVNKKYHIEESFVPSNLVDVTYTRKDRDKGKMDKTAEKALCALLEEAYYYGYNDVTVTSAYRSYSSQAWYFNYYIEREMASGKSREQAEAAVLTYSARPGTSEHQTGLCVDMHNLPAANQSFGNTEAGKWLAANAHRFGFIIRYPNGKEDITGYSYEPWHFRFVGIKHSSVMYEEGLCLEEYLEKYYPEKLEG